MQRYNFRPFLLCYNRNLINTSGVVKNTINIMHQKPEINQPNQHNRIFQIARFYDHEKWQNFEKIVKTNN